MVSAGRPWSRADPGACGAMSMGCPFGSLSPNCPRSSLSAGVALGARWHHHHPFRPLLSRGPSSAWLQKEFLF